MPRNVSGTYSLPLPPVVANTVIQAAWANTTDDDIAQAITDSLDRNGRGGMIAPFRLVDGTPVQPAFAFASETGTGIYKVSAGVMGVSVMGVQVAQWSGTAYSLFSDFDVAGDFSVTGLITFTGDIAITGGIAVTGGITSFDDISVIENVNANAGFFATNNSAGTGAYAGYTATNDAADQAQFVMTSSVFSTGPGPRTALLYGSSTGGVQISAGAAAGPIRFTAGGFTEQMRLTPGGNLGIGTTTPTVQLHVVGTNPSAVVTAVYPGAGNTPGNGNFLGSAINSSGTSVAQAGMQIAFTRILDTDYASTLLFYTATDNTAIERMRIGSNGNVGIKTTTTSWTLGLGDTTTTNTELHLRNSAAGLGLVTIDQAAGGVICMVHNGSGAGFIGIPTGATGIASNVYPMLFATSGVERMHLNTTGEFGIGTAPLGGVILQVKVGTNQNFGVLTQSSLPSLVGLTDAGSSTGLRIVGNPLWFSGNGSTDHVFVANSGILGMSAGFSSAANSAVSVNVPAGNAILTVQNTSTTAGSGARLEMRTAGVAAAGDPHIYYIIPGGFDYITGINNADFSWNVKIGSSLAGASGFQLTGGGLCRSVQGGTGYTMTVDPASSAIPVGGIILGRGAGAGMAAVAAFGTIALSGANTITVFGFTGTVVLSSGTYRLLGRETNATNVDTCLWVRTA